MRTVFGSELAWKLLICGNNTKNGCSEPVPVKRHTRSRDARLLGKRALSPLVVLPAKTEFSSPPKRVRSKLHPFPFLKFKT